MLEGINFSYDGKFSVDYGLINCKVNGGLFEEQFVAPKEIKEVRIRGNEKPYFQEVVRSPLEFSLTFAFEEEYNEEQIRAVAHWLDKDYYAPFYTDSNPERIYYCTMISDSQLIHNGASKGYITLKFRCNSPYSYSPQKLSKVYYWNQTSETRTHGTFTDGLNSGLITDSNGNLIINPTGLKWINIDPSRTWNDV